MIIYMTFIGSIVYSLIVLTAAYYTGLMPISNKNHFKCDISLNRVLMTEAAIFGLSLYLNLLLGILTATGDSYFFVTVMTRFTKSDTPFAGFYANGGISYPPLFNYIYYVLSQILKLFHIPIGYTNEAFIFSVKLPGILCEFFMAGLLYRYAKKNLSYGQTIPVLLLTLLNPAYLLITAYICQIDALYVFFMLVTILSIYEKKLKLSYFTFAAATLCKFQAIFITPVMIYAIINEVFLHDFSWKKFWKHLLAGLSAILCMFLSYLPFVWNFSSHTFYKGGVTVNLTNSLKSYGLASQNAYNFWNLLGYNYLPEDLYFGPLTCEAWGTIFIVLLVLLCSVLFYLHRNSPDIYPMLGAVLVSGTICFATRMMARYLYPAIPFLILGFLLKPTRRRFLCALAFTVALFLLNSFDYLIYPIDLYSAQLILPKIISIYMLGCFCFLVHTIFIEKE